MQTTAGNPEAGNPHSNKEAGPPTETNNTEMKHTTNGPNPAATSTISQQELGNNSNTGLPTPLRATQQAAPDCSPTTVKGTTTAPNPQISRRHQANPGSQDAPYDSQALPIKSMAAQRATDVHERTNSQQRAASTPAAEAHRGSPSSSAADGNRGWPQGFLGTQLNRQHAQQRQHR